MSPRPGGRIEQCSASEALARLDQAKAFLDVAELAGGESDPLATPGVAAALAVLAGIAACDAVCCAVLGQRSRGQDHRQAATLLRQITPDGRTLALDLERLLAIKDDAHYGTLHISTQRTKTALRQARRLVDAAAVHTR
ncbi:hypothetical protein ACWDTP_11545 [Mycobacterium sp. NPDC003449]